MDKRTPVNSTALYNPLEHILSSLPWLCRALETTGNTKRCLNLGSYNYLGFAAADEFCTPRVQHVLKQYGGSMCSSRLAAGIATFHLAYYTMFQQPAFPSNR